VGDFHFITDNSGTPATKMLIANNGNVGIGTTSPSDFHSSGQRLVVGDGAGDEGISIYSGSDSNGSIMFADASSGAGRYVGRIYYDHNANDMKFSVNGSTSMTLDDSGNVGIGTTDGPDYKLQVNGTGDFTKIRVGGTTVTGILDQDNMSSDSVNDLATQQSIKAYVDAHRSFKTISAAGQANVVADATHDTLTLVGGTNVSIATNATTDTITFTSTDTNTTYSAGDGIALVTGNKFQASLTSNGGIELDSSKKLRIDLSHSSITGTLAISDGGTGQTSKTNAFDALSPATTSGDIIYHNGSDNVRLAKGANGKVLSMASGIPSWQTVDTGLPAYGTLTDGVLLMAADSGTKVTNCDIQEYTSTNSSTHNYSKPLIGIGTKSAAPRSGAVGYYGTTTVLPEFRLHVYGYESVDSYALDDNIVGMLESITDSSLISFRSKDQNVSVDNAPTPGTHMRIVVNSGRCASEARIVTQPTYANNHRGQFYIGDHCHGDEADYDVSAYYNDGYGEQLVLRFRGRVDHDIYITFDAATSSGASIEATGTSSTVTAIIAAQGGYYVESGETLHGDKTATINYTPKIITGPTPQGIYDKKYRVNVGATGGNLVMGAGNTAIISCDGGTKRTNISVGGGANLKESSTWQGGMPGAAVNIFTNGNSGALELNGETSHHTYIHFTDDQDQHPMRITKVGTSPAAYNWNGYYKPVYDISKTSEVTRIQSGACNSGQGSWARSGTNLDLYAMGVDLQCKNPYQSSGSYPHMGLFRDVNVFGRMQLWGGIYVPSDRKLKENIKYISSADALDIINELKGVTK
jgi:hypothetical protein